MTPTALLPRQPVPALDVALTSGGRVVLAIAKDYPARGQYTGEV